MGNNTSTLPLLDRGVVAQGLYGHLPWGDAIKEADRVVAFLVGEGIVSKDASAVDLPSPYAERTMQTSEIG